MIITSYLKLLDRFNLSDEGPGTGLSPLEISNSIISWIDATDINSVVYNSTGVETIQDKSGNGRNLTSASFPAFSIIGGAANKPFINLSGKSMQTAEFSSNQPFSVYMVYKQIGFANGVPFFKYAPENYNGLKQDTLSGNQVIVMSTQGRTGPYYFGFEDAGKWKQIAATFNIEDSSMSVDEERPISMSVGTDENHDELSLLYIGANIHFHELVVFDGVLSAEDDIAIRRHFASKYKLVSTRTIQFFGDSITFGQAANNYGTSSFAARVAHAKGYHHYNYGVGGSSVMFNGAVLPAALRNQLHLANDPKMLDGNIFIAYGSNDSNYACTPQWKQELKECVEILIDYGYAAEKITLATQPYQDIRASLGPGYVTAISQVANELGTAFYDSWNYTLSNGGQSLIADDLHPTDDGHAVYAAGAISHVL